MCFHGTGNLFASQIYVEAWKDTLPPQLRCSGSQLGLKDQMTGEEKQLLETHFPKQSQNSDMEGEQDLTSEHHLRRINLETEERWKGESFKCKERLR